jgi:hypothetical protein
MRIYKCVAGVAGTHMRSWLLLGNVRILILSMSYSVSTTSHVEDLDTARCNRQAPTPLPLLAQTIGGEGEPGSGWVYEGVFLYILHCQIQKRHQKQMDKLNFIQKCWKHCFFYKNVLKDVFLGVLWTTDDVELYLFKVEGTTAPPPSRLRLKAKKNISPPLELKGTGTRD